jgi:hypothetical protein
MLTSNGNQTPFDVLDENSPRELTLVENKKINNIALICIDLSLKNRIDKNERPMRSDSPTFQL